MIFEIVQSHTRIGFSGSRHGIDPDAGELAAAAVPAGAEVVVGCAAGVDAFFRSRFPAARVLRVDSSLGRAGFARRSIACVEAVSRGLWVSFPSGACPSGLFPPRLLGGVLVAVVRVPGRVWLMLSVAVRLRWCIWARFPLLAVGV